MMHVAALLDGFMSMWGIAWFVALWALKAAVGWVVYRFWKARRRMTEVQK